MTGAGELYALAKRCEQAAGPSRHLDTQIFILLDPDAEHIVGTKPGPFPQEPIYGPRLSYWEWACDESKEPPAFAPIPAFTASLDAAMTLVPEGYGFMLDGESDRWFVDLDAAYEMHATAKTPSLALCAAALRARASQVRQ